MSELSLVEIGQRLAEARESRGISLEQAEQETRIRLKYLMAMESGDFDALPNEVVARGFLRSYAQFLGLDPRPLLQAYQKARPSAAPAPPTRPPERGPHVLEMDLGRRSGGAFARFLSAALIVVLVGVAGYLLTLQGMLSLPVYRGAPSPTPTPTEVVSTPTSVMRTPTPLPSPTPVIPAAVVSPRPSPTVTQALMPTVTPTSVSTPTPTPFRLASPTSTPTPVPVEKVNVEARIVDRTWLRVLVDGKVVDEGLYEPDTTLTWEGQTVEIRTGNAGGMELTVNGRALGPLGKKGDVIHWIFTVQDGEVVRLIPTPTPTPSEG